ncbi:MAG: restriction endonuclease subunit S [Hydrogenophaga sp.]|uniref:restriction endonuclease subunit S n=1 Tax=Hydrogenophaga sp. TaxID=1904254 RepID=UPI003D0E29D9
MELNEPSAKYLVQAGYKQTELGTLPVDWEVIQLGNFDPFVTSGSRGWARYYSETGSTFLRITNLSRDTIFPDLSDLRYVSIPANDSEGERTKLVPGDVLISITADVGIVGYVSESVPTPAFVNQHIALVRFSPEKLDTKYLSYFLAGSASQSALRALADSGAKAGMNLNTVLSVKAALPPTSEEQKAISDALTDADALIESLEQLLAKKHQIKQGVTKELLTGQRRLPGFSKSWSIAQLSDICQMKSGEPITSERIDEHSQYPCYGGNGIRGFTDRFTHSGSHVLVGRQGALCGNVAFVGGKFFASEHAVVVTSSVGSDICWLGYVLTSLELNQYSESSAQPGLAVSRLLTLEVLAPDALEQAAIATILSDMDTEITALEARLTKARQLKQGMAQALLTGRIRLV